MRALPLLALAAIGAGLWMFSPPLSLVVVGALVWIDGYVERGGGDGSDT